MPLASLKGVQRTEVIIALEHNKTSQMHYAELDVQSFFKGTYIKKKLNPIPMGLIPRPLSRCKCPSPFGYTVAPINRHFKLAEV